MAEQRERLGTVLLKLGGNKGASDWTLEVFDARDWPEQPEADTGLYRLRVGGKWVMASGNRFSFFNVWGIALLIAKALLGLLPIGALDESKPNLRRGQPVRWRPSDEELCQRFGHSTKCRALSDPIQCIDGQWRILMNGGHLVLCGEVQGLDRFGRDITTKTSEEAA